MRQRSAIFAESASSISLATAQALARAGANVMLNGFGDGEPIEAMRASLAKARG